LELRNREGLLHRNADGSAWHQSSAIMKSSDSKKHVMSAENLETANSLAYNPTVSNMELENFRLKEYVLRLLFWG